MVRVPLTNVLPDAEFAGTIFIGKESNQQEATLVFDTGSEYLTVTSNLCDTNDKLIAKGESEEDDSKKKGKKALH